MVTKGSLFTSKEMTMSYEVFLVQITALIFYLRKEREEKTY